MKRLRSLLAVFLILPASLAHAQSAVGVWKTQNTEEGHLEVRIADCGAKLCGTIVGAVNTQGQSGPYEHMGRQMIWDMTPNGAGQWSGGKIWDPRNGKTYSSKMALKGNSLSVSGCFIGICQAKSWRRLK